MALTERHKQYLHLMGIQPWELRNNEPAAPIPALQIESSAVELVPRALEETQPDVSLPSESVATSVTTMNWQQLEAAVSQCHQCELHQSRTQTVFGVGNQQAQWMVVGEAPGADEDRQGEPFVGRAGQLLNNMLYAIGLKRETVYIANILKCRPPNNRDPKPEEVAHCEAYLKRQVALIRPKIILAVGRIAAHNLLKTDVSLAKLRQKTFQYADTQTPLIITYHPAYLLRSPREKRKAWQDLQYAVSVYKQQS
jgi:uracil-DNA glycosylase family 4